MRCGQIFRSEGGYRLCGAEWNGCPVIDASPWFEHIEQAQIERRRETLRGERDKALERANAKCQTWEEYEKMYDTILAEYDVKINAAQPMVADDDPK